MIQSESPFLNRTKFDLLMKPFGGRLEIERIEPAFVAPFFLIPRARINAFLNKLTELEGFRNISQNLLFDYIFHEDCNAIATKLAGYTVFGVNSGFVDTVMMASNKLFANPEFFPGLGFAELENNQHKDFTTGFNLTNDIIESDNTSMRFKGWELPNCVERRYYAAFVSELAVEFAFLHELGHILCGHLDLCKFLNLPLQIRENIVSEAQEKDLIRQLYCAEYDADAMALQMQIIGELIYEPLQAAGKSKEDIRDDWSKISNEYDSIESQRRTAQYVYPIAVNIAMLLFAQSAPTFEDWDSSDHPHPLSRLIALDWGLIYLVERKIENIDNIFKENWFRASRHTMSIWKKLKLPGYQLFPPDDKKVWDKLYENVLREMIWSATDEKGVVYIGERLNLREVGNAVFKFLRVMHQ